MQRQFSMRLQKLTANIIANFNAYSDTSEAETLELADFQFSVMFNRQCLEWRNGSQLAVHRQRWSTAVANTITHDGYGSVNTAKNKRAKT